MKVTEVRARAREMGLKVGKLSKTQLIRAIQSAEGNIPCFATERVQDCGEEGCRWRTDCLNSNKV